LDDAVQKLSAFVNQQFRRFPQLVVVGDNPSVDIGVIDRLFEERNLLPLQKRGPKFFFILDLRCLVTGLLRQRHANVNLIHYFAKCYGCQRKDVHNPVEDALYWCAVYGAYLKATKKNLPWYDLIKT